MLICADLAPAEKQGVDIIFAHQLQFACTDVCTLHASGMENSGDRFNRLRLRLGLSVTQGVASNSAPHLAFSAGHLRPL